MAARDTRLQLEAAVLSAFERHVQRLVTPVTADGSFIRAMLMVLCWTGGRTVSPGPAAGDTGCRNDGRAKRKKAVNCSRVCTTQYCPSPAICCARVWKSFHPATSRGAHGCEWLASDVEIDLTDEAISKLLLKHLSAALSRHPRRYRVANVANNLLHAGRKPAPVAAL